MLGEASLASAQEKEAIVMKDTGVRGQPLCSAKELVAYSMQ